MTAFTDDDNHNNKECRKCVDMLTKVLLGSNSSSSSRSSTSTTESSSRRALQLLRAMGAGNSTNDIRTNLTVQPNGVTVSLSSSQPSLVETTTTTTSTSTNKSASASKQAEPSIRIPTITTATNLATSPIVPSQPQPQQEEELKIECRPCGNVGPEGGARAYVLGPDPLSVVLCSNRLPDEGAVRQALVHELVHVHDVRRLQLDLRVCNGLAYSEVRAAREAECAAAAAASWFVMPQQSCVRQKATTATRNLFPQQGRDCVHRVFDEAFKDTRPFARDGGRRHSQK